MPEKETILRRTSLLPTIASPFRNRRQYGAHETWENDEPEVHFRITKEKLFPEMAPAYLLYVSGEESGIEKIIADFKNAFGEPEVSDIGPSGAYSVIWNASQADKKIKV